FFIVFIFLGACLQKFFSETYLTGEMFELELLIDPRFRAFGQMVGIDPAITTESLRNLALLQNWRYTVANNAIQVPSNDYVHLIAMLITAYDFYVQVAIGLLFAIRRAVTDRAGH